MSGPHLPSHHRRDDVDGLRGLAVLLVVLFHAGFSWFSGAFVAVDVFFVLSGFFLATSLTPLLVSDDRLDVGTVAARRAWRLLPALAVVLVATLASAMLLYAPIDRARVAGFVAAASVFVSNLVFASTGVNYFSSGENPLLHTWTLGVELQMLLVFPALLALFAAIGRRRAGDETGQARRLIIARTVFAGIAVLGVASFIVSVLVSSAAPMWAYFGPHTRLWALCAGAAMAFIAGGGQSVFGASVRAIGITQFIGLAAIFVPALVYDSSMTYPGAIALAPVFGTLCLLAGGAIATEAPVGRVLSARPLVAIGRVSYPWYLWHLPLMVLGSVLAPGIGPWGRLVWGAVGLALAIVTHRAIERPVGARLMPRILAGRPGLAAVGVAATLALIAVVAGAGSDRYVAHSVHRVFAAARGDHMEHACWVRSVDDPRRGDCAFGDVSSRSAIALLGDSHAEHWLGGLERAGKEHGWRVEANVMGGCPASDLRGFLSGGVARHFTECVRYHDAMVRAIIARRPRAVLLSNFDDYLSKGDGSDVRERLSTRAWITAMRRTYERFHRSGIPVIVLRGTPRVPFDVPSCLSRRAAGLPFATDCTFAPDRAFMARARRAQDAAARGLGVRFVDMNDQVCAEATCETMRGGLVLFTDDNHLTASFTRSLGGVLGERLASALR